jgi:hypothetical protein
MLKAMRGVDLVRLGNGQSGFASRWVRFEISCAARSEFFRWREPLADCTLISSVAGGVKKNGRLSGEVVDLVGL